MQFGNPFGFRGCIGRVQFWLTMIAASILEIPLLLFPVKQHHVLLSTYGGFGESFIGYATPIEPITTDSWLLLMIFYLIMLVLFWLICATVVQRLHDLGRSGKWLLLVVGALAVNTMLEAVFSRPGQPLSTFEIVNTIFLAPFALIGAWGMIEMLFVRGYGANRYDSLPDNDVRTSVS